MVKPMMGLLIFILLFTSTAFSETKTLRFGVFPYKSSKSLAELFIPIAKRIEKRTGYKVIIVTAPSYDAYMSRAAAEDYDIIMPCTACYLTLHKSRIPYTVIAMGAPYFYGGTIVRKDSGVKTIEQLKGEKIASVGSFSYASFKYLKDWVVEKGYTVPGDYTFVFLGKLDSVIFSVVNRKFKAGVIRTDALNNRLFEQVKDDLVVIHTSTKIPQFPFAVHSALDKSTVESIRQVLIDMTMENDADAKVLKKLKIKKIVDASDSDYDNFRKIYNR